MSPFQPTGQPGTTRRRLPMRCTIFSSAGALPRRQCPASAQSRALLSASWDGASGGGTSLVLGTVNTASGIPSYTINSAGSGLTNGVYDYSGWSIG